MTWWKISVVQVTTSGAGWPLVWTNGWYASRVNGINSFPNNCLSQHAKNRDQLFWQRTFRWWEKSINGQGNNLKIGSESSNWAKGINQLSQQLDLGMIVETASASSKNMPWRGHDPFLFCDSASCQPCFLYFHGASCWDCFGAWQRIWRMLCVRGKQSWWMSTTQQYIFHCISQQFCWHEQSTSKDSDKKTYANSC